MTRIMATLFSLLWAMGLAGDGWRRYLSLILNVLSPAAPTLHFESVPLLRPSPRPRIWPI
ncbi:hypothetical protein [Streptomyces agglomeratus]|uniref:hypothetical protein n=1 Tax=Streptomyces agglomeratus TaxID=285458 RepID=UPI000854BE46|nr:hypothetical protein [Streptomyces agglomeratus]